MWNATARPAGQAHRPNQCTTEEGCMHRHRAEPHNGKRLNASQNSRTAPRLRLTHTFSSAIWLRPTRPKAPSSTTLSYQPRARQHPSRWVAVKRPAYDMPARNSGVMGDPAESYEATCPPCACNADHQDDCARLTLGHLQLLRLHRPEVSRGGAEERRSGLTGTRLKGLCERGRECLL